MAKIAVVDDSEATVNMLNTILKAAGHEVIGVVNSSDAEARLKEELPDLILMDIVMPEKNGYELIRAFRRDASTKDIPIIIMSTKGETTDIAWGKRQGAVDYIVKPFSPEKIMEAVNQQLLSVA